MNQPLSWRVIVGYSLGDVANNFAFAMGALFLLSYYTDVAGVGSDRRVSTMTSQASVPPLPVRCSYWYEYLTPSPMWWRDA
ncbi:Glucuronide transporter UidB [Salmonella enterica subsp. enterica serovar Montevideo str. S5-403]|uniref:Glucuronide transporter UidB n=1 Tax=Salmonella enterica subsp. enterica serovar Montevideo str. S5-403 TaxID=913242 RepID=G5Q7S1_SALMO|nr:Glucuronide transporter UidB [Salmonella enterica subsp. enterica serovar Montevideo str. S5-403]